jgi:hypothetical protein
MPLRAFACTLCFTATIPFGPFRFDFYVCGYQMFYNVITWVLIT